MHSKDLAVRFLENEKRSIEWAIKAGNVRTIHYLRREFEQYIFFAHVTDLLNNYEYGVYKGFLESVDKRTFEILERGCNNDSISSIQEQDTFCDIY